MSHSGVVRGPLEYGYQYVAGQSEPQEEPREREIIDRMTQLYTQAPSMSPNAIAAYLNKTYQYARVYYRDGNKNNREPQNLRYSKFHANGVTNCLKRRGVFRSTEISEQKVADSKVGLKSTNNLTKVVSHFKPRRLEELKARIDFLKSQKSGVTICAITGISGCGKSELAKAYAWQYGSGRSNVSEVFRWRLDPDAEKSVDIVSHISDLSPNTESHVSYEQAFVLLLENFDLHSLKAYDSEAPEQMRQRLTSTLWQKINLLPHWILIFDNVGSYTDVQDYLPTGPSMQGQILITTQNSHFLANHHEANFSLNQGLEQLEATELLRELSGQDQEDETSSLTLVKALDYSPLGIRVAGRYIYNVQGTSFQTYAQILQQNGEAELINIMGGPNFVSQATHDSKRLATSQAALKLSIQKLRNINPRLRDILQYCGYLANENIPLDLLTELSRDSDQNSAMVKQRLLTLLRGKNNYSLVSYDEVSRSCYLHRTTQLIIRSLTPCPISVITRIVALILQLYPYDYYSIDNIKKCRQMAFHFWVLIQEITSDAETARVLVIQRLRLLITLGQLAYTFSQYSTALQYVQEAWKIAQASGDECQEFQVDALRYLAVINRNLSEYPKAAEYINKALEMAEKIYKPVDWQLARLYNDKGEILRLDRNVSTEQSLRAFREAEKICLQIQVPCKEHNLQLASSYRGIGRFLLQQDISKALECLQQALQLRLQHLGNLHPYTAHVYKDLGITGLVTDDTKFVDLGIDYATSLLYLESALSIYTLSYGCYDHTVADVYYWQACLFYVSYNLQDWQRALQDIDQSIQIYKQILGEKSQNLISCYYWQGRILQKLNRDPEAKDAYRNSLKICKYHPGESAHWLHKTQLQQVSSDRSANLRLTLI